MCHNYSSHESRNTKPYLLECFRLQIHNFVMKWTCFAADRIWLISNSFHYWLNVMAEIISLLLPGSHAFQKHTVYGGSSLLLSSGTRPFLLHSVSQAVLIMHLFIGTVGTVIVRVLSTKYITVFYHYHNYSRDDRIYLKLVEVNLSSS